MPIIPPQATHGKGLPEINEPSYNYNYTVREKALINKEIEAIQDKTLHTPLKTQSVGVKKGQKLKTFTKIWAGGPVPRLDKLAFTVPVTDITHRKHILETMVHLKKDISNFDKHISEPNDSKAYRHAFNYRTPHKNLIRIEFAPYKPSINFIRVECNPRALAKHGETTYLTGLVKDLFADELDLSEINISRLDICVDIAVPVSSVAVYVPGYKVAKVFKDAGGAIQTHYLGTQQSKIQYCIYNKTAEALSKGVIVGKEITRVECRLKHVKVSDLLDLNPFEKLQLYVCSPLVGTKDFVWKWFLDRVMSQGLVVTLAEMPPQDQKLYRNRLSEYTAAWWDPIALYDAYRAEIANLITILSGVTEGY